MDILRHAPQVTVVAPSSLRDRVVAQLRAAVARYRAGRDESPSS